MNCTANAFQHSILWNGRVSPAVTLSEGDQARNPAYIIADLTTVCAAFAMAASLEFQTRAVGVLTATFFAALGLALYAIPPSIATTSAGQVFYGIGFTGLRLLTDVLIADTTDFRHRALGYAFISSSWAVTAFAVPTMRRAFSVAQLRTAIAAFAGIVLFCGLVLFAFLQYYRRRTVDFEFDSDLERLVRAVKEFATGPASTPNPPKTDGYMAPTRSLAVLRLWAQWRLKLSLSALCVVLALLVVFVVLWLIQMEIVPWYAAIPVVAVYFGILAFLVALKSESFKNLIVNFLVQLPELPCCAEPAEEGLNYSPRSLWARLYRKENADGTGDSILGALRTRNMMAVCVIAILWKCGLPHSGNLAR